MTCDAVTKLIPLYYYGDLTPEEEDLFDQHLHECAACTAEMERQRVLAAALDRRRIEPPALLLEELSRIDATAAGLVDVRALITHHYTLDELPEAIAWVHENKDKVVKAVVRP